MAEVEHAGGLVTTRYVTSGWLAFDVRRHLPIIQITENYRWSDAPLASPELLKKPLLYVTQHPDRELCEMKPFFASLELKGCAPRTRSGVTIDCFCVYRLSGFHDARTTLR